VECWAHDYNYRPSFQSALQKLEFIHKQMLKGEFFGVKYDILSSLTVRTKPQVPEQKQDMEQNFLLPEMQIELLFQGQEVKILSESDTSHVSL
jgi:hypothetical protein